MKTEYADTTELQLTSLIAFANGLGYDEVYSPSGSLLRFKNEKNRKGGQEYIGIARMIKLHDYAAEDMWRYLATVDVGFQTFINDDIGYDAVVLLFAGTCKIVQKIKGQYKRGVGFHVEDKKSSHMIRFMTDRDYAHYKHYVGE